MISQKVIMLVKFCIVSLLVVLVASQVYSGTISPKVSAMPSQGSTMPPKDLIISSKDLTTPPKENNGDKMKKNLEELKKNKNVDTLGCYHGGQHDFGAIKESVHVDGCIRMDEGNCVLHLGKVANIKFAFTATEEMTKATSISYGFCGIAFLNFCIPDPNLKKINFCDHQVQCPLEKGKTYVVNVEKQLPSLPMGINLVAQVSLVANEKTVGCVKMPLDLVRP